MRRQTRKHLVIAAVGWCTATHVSAQETPMVSDTPGTTATAPAAPDPTLAALDAEKARLDKEAAVLVSRKALRDAEAGAATSMLGPLGTYTGQKGDVTVDSSNRSVLEANLLAAVALDNAGDQIGLRLCQVVAARATQQASCGASRTQQATAAAAATAPALIPVEHMSQAALCTEIRTLGGAPATIPSARPIIIVSQSTVSVTDLADTFLLRTTALGREICAALEMPTKGVSGEVAGGSAALIGAAVISIANLFRADYTVYGIALTADQSLLSKRVALAFMASGLANPVYLPDLSPFSPLDANNPAIRRLAVLDGLRGFAVANSNAAARARLDAAIKAYDDAVAVLTTSTEGKQPLLAAVIRQARTAELIRQGGYLVVTNVHVMGGTSYTKKNFFTFLGGMPYFVSGGALASYLVQDGVTGPILDTVTIPVMSGFHRANQLDRAFPRGANRP